MSSAEGEYRAMASSVAEVIWMTWLLKELGVTIKIHVSIISDSKSFSQISVNHVIHEKTN